MAAVFSWGNPASCLTDSVSLIHNTVKRQSTTFCTRTVLKYSSDSTHWLQGYCHVSVNACVHPFLLTEKTMGHLLTGFSVAGKGQWVDGMEVVEARNVVLRVFLCACVIGTDWWAGGLQCRPVLLLRTLWSLSALGLLP